MRAGPTLGHRGSSFGSELNLDDRNAGGLMDVELDDGTWIGWTTPRRRSPCASEGPERAEGFVRPAGCLVATSL